MNWTIQFPIPEVNTTYILHMYVLEVLWGQPIKLIQVASTSEFCENQRNDLLFFKLFPVISGGPQKYKHKIGHDYSTF